jgi:hypothetical protein
VGESPDQEKIEIARYSQKSGYATEGLMVLDERELDDLVTILTLCAVLAVVDSFTRLVFFIHFLVIVVRVHWWLWVGVGGKEFEVNGVSIEKEAIFCSGCCTKVFETVAE